ncbi:protein phosphatase CheZ, partial [Aeromonas dhakensis]|nr:protein phosphatase CheZ [Aeromonas dhakensis]
MGNGQTGFHRIHGAIGSLVRLEQGEFEQADTLIADACAPNAAALFDKVGQLTRQLHDSLQDF